MDDDAWGYSANQLQLWRFHVDWVNPSASTLTGPNLLPTAAFDSDLWLRLALRPAARNCRTAARARRPPHVPAAISQLRHPRVPRRQPDRRRRRPGPCRHPVRRRSRSPGGAVHPPAGHVRTRPDDGASAAPRWTRRQSRGRLRRPRDQHVSLNPDAGRLAADAPGVLTQGEADLMAGSGSQNTPPAAGAITAHSSSIRATDARSGTRARLRGHQRDVVGTRIGSFAFPSCTSASGCRW